jgi:hypothetical protein
MKTATAKGVRTPWTVFKLKLSAATLNLKIKRKIEGNDKSIFFVLDHQPCQDLFLLIVNSEEVANKICNITLEFNARKGKPFEVKLEERTS